MKQYTVIFLPSGTSLRTDGSASDRMVAAVGSVQHRAGGDSPSRSERRHERYLAADQFTDRSQEGMRVLGEIPKLLAGSAISNHVVTRRLRELAVKRMTERSRRPSARQMASAPPTTDWSLPVGPIPTDAELDRIIGPPPVAADGGKGPAHAGPPALTDSYLDRLLRNVPSRRGRGASGGLRALSQALAR